MEKIRTLIEKALNDLLQNPYTPCDYDLVSGENIATLYNTPAIEAYMQTVHEYIRTLKPVKCYMAPDGNRAANAVFMVDNGNIYISGMKLMEDGTITPV